MANTSGGSLLIHVQRALRTVWARAIAFTGAAVLFALAAGFVGAWIPFEITVELGQNSVDSILQIVATAMLTATTFSITAMVTAYSSATTIATPRSTKLLIADPTSQTALSTFTGAFVFALVGIIALSTGYYTEQGRTILFFGTLVVIGVIVITLLRWIGHLARFGRMADVIDRVEDAASTALTAYMRRPTLGARELTRLPVSSFPIAVTDARYVIAVDVARLDALAHEHDCEVYVGATPGTIADVLHPLAHVTVSPSAALRDQVRAAFTLGRHRDYDQDPRLGVIALAEIGSRALSPGTNDPGTAIEVTAALQRVFSQAFTIPDDDVAELEHDRVWVPRTQVEDLLADAFRPLARDGAGFVEVLIRIQKCLVALAETAPEHRALLDRLSAEVQARARGALRRREVAAVRDAAGPTPSF
ncbi:DUF2254 domain-containing protein [Microbacterium sp. USHLN186]|uniref:DUF2254 domain-containing protein n=1 Tax=Microbacterium sp. USHLN186 TaxID=3081286 RepID=UPI003017AB13